jgi:hypothetical protein
MPRSTASRRREIISCLSFAGPQEKLIPLHARRSFRMATPTPSEYSFRRKLVSALNLRDILIALVEDLFTI